jgi:hypothetical protein
MGGTVSDPLPAVSRPALPLYEGESGFTLPLKQGESRAKHGRGSLTHPVEII